MKQFVIRTFLFSLFIFSFILLLQIVIFLRINHKSTTGHDNLDITSNVNSELVFLGSSRCWAHFDPFFFENEFGLKSTNIGVDGHSEISMAYIRLLDYLKVNVPPKYAILSFDPFMSGGDISKPGNKIHKDNFARYAFVPLNNNWEIVRYFGFNKWEKYFPLYSIFKYKQLANCLFQNNISTYVKYGYERHDAQWDTLKNPIVDRMKQEYIIDKQTNEVKEALSLLNKLCSNNGIKLICIQTPVYKSIFNVKSFEIPKTICTDLGIVFIDANYVSIRTDIKNFYNSNHLNIKGITAMNNKLKAEKRLIEVLK